MSNKDTGIVKEAFVRDEYYINPAGLRKLCQALTIVLDD
jgi:hypothetical protein